jgi:hypothetical protein
MLTSVIGVLLAASLGSPSHTLEPDDVCLLKDGCAREAIVCLVDDDRCATWRDDRVCLVDHCPDRGPELP